MLCAKFSWNLPYDSGEEVENVKRYRQTDRQAPDKKWSIRVYKLGFLHDCFWIIGLHFIVTALLMHACLTKSYILASLLHKCFVSFTCSIHCLPQCSPQCFPWVMIYMLALLSHMLTSLRYCQCVKFCQIHLHKTMLCLPLDQSLLNQGFHSSPEIGRSPLTSSIYSYEKLQNPLKFENSTEMLDVKKVSYICKL